MKKDIDIAIEAVKKASHFIMSVYIDEDLKIEYKDKDQPVTIADRGSHDILLDILSKSKYPIISEESPKEDKDKINTYDKFWLIDPLDGTKEFIKRNDEFAILVSLIENNESILGVMYFPTSDTLYYSEKDTKAFKISKSGVKSVLKMNNPKNDVIFLTSKSNISDSDKIYKFLEDKEYNFIEKSYGASLKYAKMLENEGDIYFRYSSKMSQWDIAAPHCIIKSAGGEVVTLETREEFRYGDQKMTIPSFIIKHKNFKI